MARELAGAIETVKFAIEMCDVQRREGRDFVFEQPQGSRAWDLEAVRVIMSNEDMQVTIMHQCMYGLNARGTERGNDGVEANNYDGEP